MALTRSDRKSPYAPRQYDCKCEPFSFILASMNAAAAVAPAGTLADLAAEWGSTSRAAPPPGARGRVVGVGATGTPPSALERRLLELGFVPGEHIEILTE